MDTHGTAASPARSEVLVVGGGPGGLTAALLLARYGVAVTLVERRPGPTTHPRARGLNVRTMEILRALGLEVAVLAAGAPLARSTLMMFVETLAGRELRRVPEAELVVSGEALAPYTPCRWTQCAQDALEPLLAAAARAAGATLRFQTELLSLEQDELGVRATVRERATETSPTIAAAYLIAADGAHSPVRDALGIVTHGVDAGQGLGAFVNICFEADLSALVEDRWFGICFVENPAVRGLFLAVNNRDRWLLNVELDAADDPAAFTPERCVRLVRAAVGTPDLPVTVLSVLPWQASARVAERFRSGQVFLVGDAAHTLPPAGAFGLNLAIQDAHNLAWKLAAVLRGAAGATLLDSYEAERRPLAVAIAARAATMFDPDAPDAPPPWAEEDGEAALLAPLQDALGFRYESAALIAEPAWRPQAGLDLSGAPGTRVPHIWLARDGQRCSTLDLCEGPFVLLAGQEGAAWIAAAAALGAPPGVGLACYRVGPGGDLEMADEGGLETLGIGPRGAVLVRPDGIVAWRSVACPAVPQEALAAAITHVLGRA